MLKLRVRATDSRSSKPAPAFWLWARRLMYVMYA
jgi:hypothetical protein